MFRSILSATLIALLISIALLEVTNAAPQQAVSAANGNSASSTTTSTTSSSSSGNSAAGSSNLVNGVINMATVPLNTLTASLTSLGVPNIATGALSAVSNLFQQAGSAYGR